MKVYFNKRSIMNNREYRTYQSARLRNLKRKYAKMLKHADLKEECIELKCEIDSIERDLNS